jgi:hypothetical protein
MYSEKLTKIKISEHEPLFSFKISLISLFLLNLHNKVFRVETFYYHSVYNWLHPDIFFNFF